MVLSVLTFYANVAAGIMRLVRVVDVIKKLHREQYIDLFAMQGGHTLDVVLMSQ